MLADYEQELYSHIELHEPSIFTELLEKQAISPELDQKLRATLKSFGSTFKAARGLN
jgi:F-type H+-transporting ATPase subunit alpha